MLLQVLRAASPALLRVIALGAFFIYCTVSNVHPDVEQSYKNACLLLQMIIEIVRFHAPTKTYE